MTGKVIRKIFNRENGVAYMFLLPWLLGFFVLTIYPMVDSLYLSLTDYDMYNPPRWVGIQNYVKMFFEDERYIKSMGVTFRYVFTSVPLKLVVALLVACIMNQKIRGIGFYRAVYYIPTLLGGSVAVSMLWRRLFSGDGAINSILLSVFGIQAPAWITDPRYALYTLVLLSAWQFGSSMIIFLAGLKQIPSEYYEAASVDGANKWQNFLHITIPCLSPVILFNLVMQMISAFQSFTQAYIISGGKGGPLDSTMFATLYLYTEGFYYYEMGYASAMAWVLLAVISVLTVIVFRFTDTFVTYESN